MGINQILSCNYERISVPLMLVLKHLGFTLIATSIIPINEKTIIYGSLEIIFKLIQK